MVDVLPRQPAPTPWAAPAVLATRATVEMDWLARVSVANVCVWGGGGGGTVTCAVIKNSLFSLFFFLSSSLHSLQLCWPVSPSSNHAPTWSFLHLLRVLFLGKMTFRTHVTCSWSVRVFTASSLQKRTVLVLSVLIVRLPLIGSCCFLAWSFN